MSFIYGRRVEVPLLEISENPRVVLDDIRHRRFLHPRACPVCRTGWFGGTKDLEEHFNASQDADHAAWEVMNS